jgi:hypothetical protein
MIDCLFIAYQLHIILYVSYKRYACMRLEAGTIDKYGGIKDSENIGKNVHNPVRSFFTNRVLMSRDGILEPPILVQLSGQKVKSFSDLSFCLLFYPYFSVLQKAIHTRLEFYCFADFFCKDSLKPE